MIRKLTNEDLETTLALVHKKPAENLFIIGDIEAYGMESDIQDLWGQFEGNRLKAILLRYDQNYIPNSEGNYDVEGFAKIINENRGRIEISGLQHLVAPLKKWIDGELKELIASYILNSSAYCRNFVEPSFIHKLWQREINVGDEKRAKVIWTLFALDVWYNKCYLKNG